ncbi:hypothetical protein [Halalkalicoccus salilacus]|uniref:hypothetical protein n=1 Tax=Halalkalicoccus salilacus TaxID=3117459 RepID=UPI00300EE904
MVNEEAENGTENIHLVSERHVEIDEKGVVRHNSPHEPKKIGPSEKFPHSTLLWGRIRSEIEDEMERREMDISTQ